MSTEKEKDLISSEENIPTEQLSPEQLDQVAGGNHTTNEDNSEPTEETGEKGFFKYKKKKFFGFGRGHHGHHGHHH